MNWLNLETRTLHAPEYIGATPTTRATWLNVTLWCAQQENGGKIATARAWKDRQWQQTCGVSLREVNSAGDLLPWDGDTLTVWNYPATKEAEVQAKREAGRLGGLAKTEAKTKAVRENGALGGRPETKAEPKHNLSKNLTEGKGREGKGIILAPNGAKVDRERNHLLDALVAIDGSNPAEVTGPAWGAAAKALAEIKAVCAEVNPAEIARRAENYRTQFAEAAISPNALSKHWARCQHAGATATTRPEATVRRIVL
jgi:hypothetical protein